MYRTIANSMKDDGRFVGGVEHDYLFRRMLGLPIGRRYSPGGIFIEHLDRKTLWRETAPFFSSLRILPVRPHAPFVNRLSPNLGASIANLIARIPVLKEVGSLLMVVAERPIRQRPEGVKRKGSNTAKRIYRWYKRLRGEEPIWDLVDRV
jgi:hypothetical protein